MNNIEIEKGIPLLPRNDARRKTTWAPFEVGDSAFFVGEHSTHLSNSANSWGRNQTPQRKFAGRTVKRDGVKGTRIWRIE